MTLLKEILSTRGMSQNQLAYESRVPTNVISQVVNGRLYPCPAWRLRISEAMGLPEDSLFSEKRGEVIRVASVENDER